jgi:hypothetical protein
MISDDTTQRVCEYDGYLGILRVLDHTGQTRVEAFVLNVGLMLATDFQGASTRQVYAILVAGVWPKTLRAHASELEDMKLASPDRHCAEIMSSFHTIHPSHHRRALAHDVLIKTDYKVRQVSDKAGRTMTWA